MKVAKLFAGIFGCIGAVLLVGSMGLCLFSLNAPVRMDKVPDEARTCTAILEEAIRGRDYEQLENCIYGHPDLGLAGAPEDKLAAAVWELAQQKLTFSWVNECHLQDTSFRRDAELTYLDVASVTDELPVIAHALLTARMEEATDMTQLYDAGGQFRDDLLDQVMAEALAQACAEHAETLTVTVGVELVYRDGKWWAVPDAALLTALSGGLA